MVPFAMMYLHLHKVISHTAVCGNGLPSVKRLVRYHEDNSFQTNVACLYVSSWWGREKTASLAVLHVVSYQCIIVNLKTQQDAALQLHVC